MPTAETQTKPSATTKPTSKKSTMPVFGNVVQQDSSIAQVTEYSNPTKLVVDKAGTIRNSSK